MNLKIKNIVVLGANISHYKFDYEPTTYPNTTNPPSP